MARLPDRIRIGVVGLGWVGQEISRVALEDARVRLVGVADSDPAKAGRDLGEIIGEGRLGMAIYSNVEELLSRARPEVAVLCTTSDLEELAPAIEACVAHGAHVVTTCENIVDPDIAGHALHADLDARARKAGVVILAAGVNPGFAMDRLPILLSKATRNIRRVRVLRVICAASRRAQFQAKIGIRMTPDAFKEALEGGRVGHQGLLGSLRIIAKGLGVVLDKTSETIRPLIADFDSSSSVLGPVRAGEVCGVYQIARGYRAGRELITLEMIVSLDEPNPRDTIDIVGEPPLHFTGEIPGDACTVATVLSTIPVVVTMQAGLRNVLDVPLEQPEEPLAEGADAGVAAGEVRAATQLPAPSVAADEAPAVPLPPPAALPPPASLPPPDKPPVKARGRKGKPPADEAPTALPAKVTARQNAKGKGTAKQSKAKAAKAAKTAKADPGPKAESVTPAKKQRTARGRAGEEKDAAPIAAKKRGGRKNAKEAKTGASGNTHEASVPPEA